MKHIIALVVHGVGDHSEVDILREVSEGVSWALKGKGVSVKISNAVFSDFPVGFGDTTAPERTLRIRTRNVVCNVIPVVWSNVRSRGAPIIQDYVAYSGHVGFLLQLSLVLKAMLGLWLDLFRCIGKARGRLWQVALTLVGLATNIMLNLAVLAVDLSLLVFPWLFYLVAFRSRFAVARFVFWVAIFWFVFPVLLLWLFKRVVRITDLLADVATYVGRPKYRQELESKMRDIVVWLIKRAPDAQIIVIGHSLGSVLVTHALLPLSSATEYAGRIKIITMGSPLGLMSRVFDRVLSPAELLTCYCEGCAVSFWANLWRDRDFIGQELLNFQDHSHFAELSLCNGPHWNYWSDVHVWEALTYLITEGSDSFRNAAQRWKHAGVTAHESKERAHHHTRLAYVWALGFVFLEYGYLIRGIFTPAAHVTATYLTITHVRLLWIAAMSLAAILFVASSFRWYFSHQRGLFAQQQLGRLRFMSPALRTLAFTSQAVWLALVLVGRHVTGVPLLPPWAPWVR